MSQQTSAATRAGKITSAVIFPALVVGYDDPLLACVPVAILSLRDREVPQAADTSASASHLYSQLRKTVLASASIRPATSVLISRAQFRHC
jgi:hypothetical protein